jgi:hypothetical protein
MADWMEIASAARTIPDRDAGNTPRRSKRSGRWASIGIMQRQPVKSHSPWGCDMEILPPEGRTKD